MTMLMMKSLGALTLGCAMAVPAGLSQADQAPSASPCTQLAEAARAQPPGAWAGQRSALADALEIVRRPPHQPPTALETALMADPELRAAVGARPDEMVGLERLPGTDVYKLDSVQGSALCQSTVFVAARPGADRHIIDPPFELTGRGLPCWTQSAAFAQLSGRPVFMVHGPDSDHGVDESYRIAPWTGVSWGASCQLKLEFRKTFRLAGEFCGDAASCSAGRGVAVAVAKAYDLARSSGGELAAESFTMGRQPPAAITAAVGVVQEPAFPTFAAERRWLDPFRTSYANAAVARFPLYLGGRWLVGVVGHAGIGWRESQLTLLSLLAPTSGGLVPVAGFQVELGNGGLIRATTAGSP